MATRAIDTASIERGTGRGWADWLAWLEGIGAADMTHKAIAGRIVDEGLATGWWARSVTVAFEQHIGRRVPGQDHKGRFQVSVTRTLQGSKDDAMSAWLCLVKGLSAFDGVAAEGEPRGSSTDKWCHWRIGLADGTSLAASTTDRAGAKVSLTVTHDRLGSPADVERWRAFWKLFLARL